MAIPSQKLWILLTILEFVSFTVTVELDAIYEWKYVDYNWESEDQKEKAINSGEYDAKKIIISDFQPITGGRVLVTTPRLYNNPASLSLVTDNDGPGGRLLEPYPSWSWHKSRDCSAIISVNKLYLDDCDKLWLVDSGKIENEQICPAKLLAFDPETDELLKSVEIPLEISHSSKDPAKGRPEIIAAKTDDDCEETWAYIGDPEGYGLIIWDGSSMWRLENDDVFGPDPAARIFEVAGQNVTLDVGIASTLLLPNGFVKEDYLLFKPLASKRDFAVSLNDLHNSQTEKVTYYRGNITLPSQELGRAISKTGIVMGGFATQPVVACFNLRNPLADQYVGTLLQDEEALQFTSSVKIVEGPEDNFRDEAYYVLTNRLQKFLTGTMDFTDVNYRILSKNLASLVGGTVCEPESHSVARTIEEKFFFEYETV